MIQRNCSLLVARCPADWGLPETLWHNFTKEQSENMITAVQTRLGPGYTITHLGQAACLLAQIKMNPGDIPVSSRGNSFSPACLGSYPGQLGCRHLD